jgi:hypothetical protein
MELVFKSAILCGQREKASPCIGIAEELGVKHLEVEHHRALPYTQVPGFIQTLRESLRHEITKLAFEWLILTATRSGETGAHAATRSIARRRFGRSPASAWKDAEITSCRSPSAAWRFSEQCASCIPTAS